MLKKLLFLGCGVLLFCAMISKSVAQTITLVVVTNTSGAIQTTGYCAGQPIRVLFSTTITGTPTFSVQLSDAAGVFPATPTIIGSGTSSPITATIPVGTSAGTGYKVRVVSGATISAGSTAFQVNPVATVNPIASINPCSGTVVGGIAFSSSSGGAAFSWTSSANVGFGTSGSGNIPSFTASNGGTTATVTVTPSVNGCTGVPTTFTVSVRPVSSVNSISNINLCNGSTGAAINFSSTPAGATFAWTSSANVGFGTSGTGNIPAYTATNTTSSPIIATVTVTPTADGCPGSPRTFTVTVFPTNVTLNPVASVSYCDDASGVGINFSSSTAGTTFDWISNLNVGFGTSGSGNIPSFTANNNGTTDAIATVTVTPKTGGCPGVPTTFTVTVRPRATVNSVSNTSLCNGTSAPAISFSSASAGATFNWTSSANVGFGLSGTGNIPAYTATNNGTSTTTATITVTPNVSGCTGNSTTFTVTVNPTATVNTISNASFCGGIPVAGTTFSSPTSGTTFSWTSSANVGFGTSGSGNIPAYTTISTNTTQVVSTITVTPSAGGCPGIPKTFTITVNPTPTINTASNAVYCNNTPAAAITFSSSVAGTTFSWTSLSNVGFGLSGTGNIPAYTATNTGSNQLVSTINVTPTTGTCTGSATTFTVTVNPTPVVGTIANATYCGNTNAAAIAFSSATLNTTYNWASSSNVGFGTSGTGNINAYTTLDNDSEVIGTVTVTPTANMCVGTPKTFTITVNPSPKVNNVANAVFCNATSAPAISFSSPTTGITFNWSSSSNVGFGTTGSGNIVAYTATNAGAGIVISTVNVTAKTATCTGPTRAFTITVNPTPTINPISNTTYCGTASGTPINFSSPVSGTTFAWSSTANVGFGTSGNDNIAGYTVTNPITSATTATVTVNPTANGCAGTTSTFNITVNPTPAVNPVSNVTLCAGATGSPITFSSDTPNTNFNWSTPTNVGFGIAGSGNIAAYTATNAGAGIVISTVNVTAKTATCTGPTRAFTITVNPTPTINPISNTTYCGTASGTPINFSSPVSGTTFAWSSTANIGFGTSGNGNIAGYTVTNPITSATTATVTVNPTANGCAGTTSTFNITVNPTPAVNPVSNVTLCAGATGSPITFSSDTPNTNFNWSTPTNVGFGIAGSGNIAGGFSALNNSQDVVTTTVSIVPATATCTGNARLFTFVVNPTPGNPDAPSPVVYCATTIAQPLSANGSNLKWYSEANGGMASNLTPTPSTNNSTDNSLTTSYYVSQTNQYSCESSRSQIQVTVKPLPTFPNVSKQEYLLCQFDPAVQLDAKLQGTGQSLLWFLPNNTESDVTPTITTETGFEGTFNVLQVRDGCRGPRSEIKVNVRTTPLPTVSQFPIVGCQNATPQPLQATGTNLKWYGTNKTGGTAQTTPNVPPTQTPGNYQFYVTQTGTNGCESPRAEITVIIQPLPSATLSGGSTITQGQSAPLSVLFTGQGPWTYTLSNGLTLTTTQNPANITVSPLETTVFTVTKITNSCGEGIPAGSATINVRVATIDVGNPNVTTICAGQAFSMPFFSSDFFPSNTQFRVQISKTMDDASFQSIPTEGSNSPLSATIPSGASGGSYYVRVVGIASNFTVKGKVSPVQITVRELPTATISGPTSIYENESAKLSIAFTGENPWRITYRDSLAQKDTTFNTSISPYEFSVRPAKTNTYRIVSISNACGNGSATSRLTLVVNPILSVTPNSSAEWIKIYPTPVQTRCTIEVAALGNQPTSLMLTDGFGRVLLRQQTSSSKDEIDFSHLNSGVYFLNAEQNGRVARRKILKIQ